MSSRKPRGRHDRNDDWCHETDDDWDYAVSSARSWDSEMDPVATARAAMAAASAAAAAQAAEEARAAASSFQGRNSAWSLFCTGGAPPRSRSCLPQTECQNELYSDEMYYAKMGGGETSSSSPERQRTDYEDDDIRDGIAFYEPEPPETSPMRHSRRHGSRNAKIVSNIPPELCVPNRDDRYFTTSSICSESSSLSSEPPPPPPPPPQPSDAAFIEEELRRTVSSVAKWTSPQTGTQRGWNEEDDDWFLLTMLPKLQRTRDKRVRFANPIVTSLKYRPMTLEEDIDDLYFSHEELSNLEADREQHEFADDFQVEILFDKKRDQLSISHHDDKWSKLPWQSD